MYQPLTTKLTLFLSVILFSPLTTALTFPIKNHSDIIGLVQTAEVQPGETLFDIARRFDLGLTDLIEANPQVNPNKLKAGSILTIPTEFILPPGPREGVVLNLAELRLYFYPPNSQLVVTHPVGIGRLGWKTPVGETKVLRKKEKPTWRPPKSIRNSYARKGKKLPLSVPPGPNNTLGEYAMYLGWPRYLIHGTNQPNSVGKRSSSGCVRMYPEDIQSLFHSVARGTLVRIIHEPFKVGKKNGQLYLEAHEPFTEKYYGAQDELGLLQGAVNDANGFFGMPINWHNAETHIKKTIGYPVPITIQY